MTASNLQSNGSANATINVERSAGTNQAPIAIISPQGKWWTLTYKINVFRYPLNLYLTECIVLYSTEQTIQLPTSSAVLDASLSTDDDKIISYKWELGVINSIIKSGSRIVINNGLEIL